MRSQRDGFTLIELLIVIAIIAILAAILLPTIERVRARARSAQCASQLRQIGIAFVSFSHDNGGQFPINVPVNSGGSLEFRGSADHVGAGFYLSFRHFEPLSNYLSNARILVCPVDRRADPADFATLQSNNISYFVNPSGRSGESDSIVSGDANLAGSAFVPALGLRLSWTRERHHLSGNVLFGDTHVEQWNNLTAGSTGGNPGGPPGVSVPQPPPYTYPRPGGGNYPNPNHGGPKPAPSGRAGSGAGGGRGVFTQLDEVAKYNARRAPSVTATQAVTVPAAQATPPAMTRPITNSPPPIVAILTPLPSVDDPWPQRLSQHLTRTGYWPVCVLLLVILALLLAFELLRRHRTRRATRRRR